MTEYQCGEVDSICYCAVVEKVLLRFRLDEAKHALILMGPEGIALQHAKVEE